MFTEKIKKWAKKATAAAVSLSNPDYFANKPASSTKNKSIKL